jgi:antitoxin ParD1/3/4
MTITLTLEQVEWLEQQVADGEFQSFEDAVRLAVADLMTLDPDDLVWARPLLEEARAAMARGESIQSRRRRPK